MANLQEQDQKKMEGSNPSPNHLLVTSMREELERLPPLSPDCCIYRVPERLRCVNEQAYTPKVVSIGPLHHGKESLRAMEKHKMRYLRSFLLRNLPAKLEDYVEKVKCQEARLRSCYEEEDIELSSDEFVRVILVDAAFVIELLLRFSGDQLENEKDRIFYKPWMIADIARDMLLLENQLPFFILQDLYDLGNIGSHSPLFSLISLSCSFLNMTVVLEGTEDNPERVPPSSSKVEHFLGLLRTLHLPLLTKAQVGGRLKTLTVPCMTELRLAGVKFKAGSSKNLFEMRFINGILEIPKMTIHDHTELVARNLVAFEQCHCVEYYLTDYFVLLDSFVDTPNDVELLARNGILENLLGDNNDVSTLINNLGNGVGYDYKNFYYATVCEDINKYCKTARHKWEASLRQKYFNTPWRAISVIAAVFLLTLATIQAVCSIISVR